MNIKIAIVVLVLSGIIYFGLAGTGSVISIRSDGATLPLDTGSFQFAGVQGNYETVKLGCLTSGPHFVLNEDNDGQTTICNSIDSTQKLTLSSSLNSNDQGTNYIEAKILLPAGKGKASYNYNLNEYYTNSVSINFDIAGEDFTYKIPMASGKGHSLSGSGDYEFALTEPKEVTFRIDTSTLNKLETSKGTLVIEYTPNEILNPQTQQGQTSNSATSLNLSERINLWISNLLERLGGLFK